MAQKQKQQQQQSVSHGEVIRCYWTPERIQCAVPKKRYRVSGKKQAIGLANDPPTEVPDATRKTSPYKSVGKLMFTQTVKGTVKHFQGTAYVAETGKGDNIVFTAAHNLLDEDGPSENLLFIPACQNDGKEVPAYGSFTGASYVVSAKWVEPFQDWYDIGAVKLTKNKDGKEVGKVVPELSITSYADASTKVYKKDETEWKIIGYVESKMYESDGVYIESEEGGKLIVRTNPVIQGMSGGPWMLKNGNGDFATANGNQSAISSDDSVTPYYSKALIDDIIAQL